MRTFSAAHPRHVRADVGQHARRADERAHRRRQIAGPEGRLGRFASRCLRLLVQKFLLGLLPQFRLLFRVAFGVGQFGLQAVDLALGFGADPAGGVLFGLVQFIAQLFDGSRPAVFEAARAVVGLL